MSKPSHMPQSAALSVALSFWLAVPPHMPGPGSSKPNHMPPSAALSVAPSFPSAVPLAVESSAKEVPPDPSKPNSNPPADPFAATAKDDVYAYFTHNPRLVDKPKTQFVVVSKGWYEGAPGFVSNFNKMTGMPIPLNEEPSSWKRIVLGKQMWESGSRIV